MRVELKALCVRPVVDRGRCVAFMLGGMLIELNTDDAAQLGHELVHAAAAVRGADVPPLHHIRFDPTSLSRLDLSDAQE